MAYNESLTVVFYLGAAAAGVSTFTSLGLGWTNLKTKKVAEEKEGKDKGKLDMAKEGEKVGDVVV